MVSPGTFQIAGKPFGGDDAWQGHAEAFRQLIYYSFVTMTTLGYGDIIPTQQIVRTFAWVQAVMGQLYIAILVARLVALQIAHSGKDNPGSEGPRGNG